MKEIASEDLLRLLRAAGAPDLKRNASRSWNGLVLKRQIEPGKARQELAATQLARFLLPRELRLPQLWGVLGDAYLVSEELAQRFERRNPEHVRQAADYLAALHAVPLDRDGLRGRLIESGHAHYRGETLQRRLKQELRFAREAFAGRPELAEDLERMAEVVAHCLATWSFDEDVVLGHGDFQASNLFVHEGAVVPIDWTDFGLCDRAYELMHFAERLHESVRGEALARYADASGVRIAELRARGVAVDGVIRAGSRARPELLAGADVDAFARRFSEHVRRAHAALAPAAAS